MAGRDVLCDRQFQKAVRHFHKRKLSRFLIKEGMSQMRLHLRHPFLFLQGLLMMQFFFYKKTIYLRFVVDMCFLA